jgi:hypothetical protein
MHVPSWQQLDRKKKVRANVLQLVIPQPAGIGAIGEGAAAKGAIFKLSDFIPPLRAHCSDLSTAEGRPILARSSSNTSGANGGLLASKVR